MRNTVIFDVGGVLTDYHKDDYFLNLGYPKEIADRLKKATQEHPAWAEFDRGVLTDEEVIHRFQKDCPELSDEIKKSMTHVHGLVTRRDTAIPWLQSLKAKGYKLYVLSNFARTAFSECHEALDFIPLMDGCFWSFEHHVIKPDDSCFLTMLYEFQINPEDAVFIDDTEKNLKAAEKFGIRTVLYQNQRQAETDLMKAMQ